MKKHLGLLAFVLLALGVTACGPVEVDGAEAKLQTAYDGLAALIPDPSNITVGFQVPVSLSGGVTAEWSSDEPGVISFGTPAGGFSVATVNRPAKADGDVEVSISALLSLQSELSSDILTKTWSLDLTVKANTVDYVVNNVEDILAITDKTLDNVLTVSLNDMTVFAKSVGEAFAYDGTGSIQIFGGAASDLVVGKVYTISGTIDWYFGIWEIAKSVATEQVGATPVYPTKHVITSVTEKINALTAAGEHLPAVAPDASAGNFEPIFARVTGKIYMIPKNTSNYNTWIMDTTATSYVAGIAKTDTVPETPSNSLMVYYGTNDYGVIQQYKDIVVTIDVVIYTYRSNNHGFAVYFVGGPTGIEATLTEQQKQTIDANSLSLPKYIESSKTLTLPTSGVNGSVIAWSSNNETVINPTTGLVTPPATGNVNVIMTASVTLGSLAAIEKSFTILVGTLENTTMEALLTKKAGDVVYSEAEVLWANTNKKAFIVGDSTGYGYVYNVAEITLKVGDFVGLLYTVAVYNGLYEITDVTIRTAKGTDPNLAPTATAWTSANIPDFDALTAWSPVYVSMELYGFASGDYANGYLPGLGSRYIQANGATSVLDGKKFTATGWIIGRASDKITIQGTYTGAVDATNAEKLAVSVAFFKGPTANAEVTGNITLPTTVKFGSVAWTSSNPAVISDAGVVTRPAIGESDVTVTLSYVITVGDQSSTPVGIEFTVKAEEPAVITYSLLAKYDLNDQVRTAYVTGATNTKYAAGAFATFLESKMVAGGTDKLASSSGETNVYTAEYSSATTGPQFNGIKFGSSSANGSVTLTFDAGTNISKVVIGCAGWSSPNTDTITVNGVVMTPIQGGAEATVEEVAFVFAASDTITITTTKRIIVNYISVYQVVA